MQSRMELARKISKELILMQKHRPGEWKGGAHVSGTVLIAVLHISSWVQSIKHSEFFLQSQAQEKRKKGEIYKVNGSELEKSDQFVFPVFL